MASSSKFSFSFHLLLLLALTPVAFSTGPSSSSVASTQLEFWSKNVVNAMPKKVASKLSPLSQQDSESLASSVLSKQSQSSTAKFCSMANLACASTYEGLQTTKFGYRGFGAYVKKSFFRLSILQKGNKVQLPNLNIQFPHRAFLPSRIAPKVSTISSNDIQKLFPESFTSPATKKAIESSISLCISIKSCPNSLEDMIEFSKKALGEEKIIAVTPKSTRGSDQELEIGNIKEFNAERVVSCHEAFFPFAAYACHFDASARLYAVDFVDPVTEAPVNRIFAVCHMDTSGWEGDDEVLEVMKLTPGQGEVCHWLNQIDLVWVAGNGEKISN